MPSPLPSSRLNVIALVNIGVALLVVALKYAAYFLTDSVALYSDALESLVNIATAVVTAAAVYLASRPPDRHHQFGHHKAEYVAAVIEGVLIVLAAAAIIRAAAPALAHPQTVYLSAAAFLLSVLATAVNGGWAWYLITTGRRTRSPALVADGWHLVTDVLTSIAVLVGLVVVKVTGFARFDALMALAVALYILWAGGKLLQQSASGLMDEAVNNEVSRKIQAVIASEGEGAIQAHDIKTRAAGRVTFIEFHLVVPGRMTVAAAHVICDRLEDGLRQAIPGAEVIIHIEPEGEARRTGAVVI